MNVELQELEENNKVLINQNSDIEDKKPINDNNYLKNTFCKNIKLNIFIIIISLILIILEFFYREPLFNYSLEFEKTWQENSSETAISTFKFFTKIGGEYLMAVPLIIIFLFFTLIKSTIYIQGFLFCLQFHSMMKIWYGSKRPFWENQNLFKGICDGGFGNPSGHSVSTSYLYLALFIYYKETKILKKKFIIQMAILLFCLGWIIVILLSRIILGVHSINQVIYGGAMGIIISLFFFKIFKLQQMPVSYYKKFYRENKYIFIILMLFAVLIAITLMNIFLFNQDFQKDKYNSIIDKLCGENYPEYRRFNFDGLFGSFVVFAMLGMYIGQILFWYLIENKYKVNKEIDNIESLQNNYINSEIKDNINNNNNKPDLNYIINCINKKQNINDNSIDDLLNHWNKNRILLRKSFKNILKIFLIIVLCIIPGVLFLVIPNNSNIVFIFLLKLGIPFFLVPFLFFSYCMYYIIKISCGTINILNERLE